MSARGTGPLDHAAKGDHAPPSALAAARLPDRDAVADPDVAFGRSSTNRSPGAGSPRRYGTRSGPRPRSSTAFHRLVVNQRPWSPTLSCLFLPHYELPAPSSRVWIIDAYNGISKVNFFDRTTTGIVRAYIVEFLANIFYKCRSTLRGNSVGNDWATSLRNRARGARS